MRRFRRPLWAVLALATIVALAAAGAGPGDPPPRPTLTAWSLPVVLAPPSPQHAPGAPRPVWISAAAVRRRPMAGPAWAGLLADAEADPGRADVSDQNSNHDVATLAAALVCARTRARGMCAKARAGVLAAIGTERGGRWLAVGRNLTAYVIAADVLGLRADGDRSSAGSRVEAWLRGMLTETLSSNNSEKPIRLVPFGSGSNASAQQGAAYAAVAAYLRDGAALRRAWNAFRRYVCDQGAPDRAGIDLHNGVDHDWAADPAHPCAINPVGTTKAVPGGRHGAGEVHRLDGSIINDMSRGGDYQWPPGQTDYPWVGLEGLVPAAVILQNHGFPAFVAGDRAVLRAVDFLWDLRNETHRSNWFPPGRSDEIIGLVNSTYGRHYPVTVPVGPGRTVGYTDWTHPAGAAR